MEKISEEFPSSIVREGGLAALLNYLDFFSIAVQRTALQAASNCCRNVSPDHFTMIQAVWPIIRNCLSYSDQRLVEFACLCVIRVIDSYYRASTENLETLVDTDLVRAVNLLLMPAGGSPLIAANTYTLLLRALATSARASPKITLALLEADIVDTLYQILTGVLPSTSEDGEEQGDASGGQGLGGSLADMTVMENLAHRSKDQVEEALSLISELMPPLPKGLSDILMRFISLTSLDCLQMVSLITKVIQRNPWQGWSKPRLKLTVPLHVKHRQACLTFRQLRHRRQLFLLHQHVPVL
jgi:E3 ubiquitin-protein ligase TRIP12